MVSCIPRSLPFLLFMMILAPVAMAQAEPLAENTDVVQEPQSAPSKNVTSPKVVSPEIQAMIDQAVQRAVQNALATQTENLEAKPSEAPTVPESDTKQTMKYVESNVVSFAGREGFRWQDESGNFLLNPYFLLQTRFQMKFVDDEGLNLADPDNVTDLGFGVPNAILGMAGKAFGKLSFNLAINSACAGKACLLNQMFLEGNVADEFRIRVGKFKTPMHWISQTRIGQSMAPYAPSSLTTRVNIPFDINTVNPIIKTGFDVGVMLHGLVADQFQYQVGIFNGEGIGVNMPTSNLSDDNDVPALMYALRLAYMPFGAVALQEGGPRVDQSLKMLIAASASYNVEANAETSNDTRAGFEFVLAKDGWYWGTEFYLLHMDFMERQRNAPSYLFWGAYTSLAYCFDIGLEPFLRVDSFDRNSSKEDGMLLMPGVGLGWYIYQQNVKLQTMYQYLAKMGHEDDLSANDDDNGMAEHIFMMQLQFSL